MSMLLLMSEPTPTELVRAMFAAGEQGIWLDPSDFSTMFQDAAGTTPVTAVGQPVGRINDKSGRGNHATQSTALSRPTVEARVNLLTYSEQFDNAAWVKDEITVSSNAGTAPDGGTTADKIVPSTASANTHRVRQSINIGSTQTFSVSVKPAGYSWVKIRFGSAWVNFDTSTGVFGLSNLGSSEFSARADVDGWYRVSLRNTVSSGQHAYVYPLPNNDTNAVDPAAWSGDGSSGVYVWAADARASSQSEYPYQKVNTATDYVDVGAPRYNAFDKTDDHLLVAAGGAGTTGFLFACGVVVPAAGTERTIFSDRGTNAGYRLSIDAANKVVFSGGTGAAFTTLTSANALTAGKKYAVIAWHDGTNLNLSINNVAETPVACGTVTAGTATFTIGKDNGAASGYWGDRIYNMVYRKNDTSAASQRSSLYSYMVGKMGGL